MTKYPGPKTAIVSGDTSARSIQGDRACDYGEGYRPDQAFHTHFPKLGERLTAWALRQRQVIEDNIWITQLPMATPPLAPSSLAWVELGLLALDEVEAPDYVKIRVLGLISLLLQDWWVGVLTREFGKRKYLILEGFREK